MIKKRNVSLTVNLGRKNNNIREIWERKERSWR